MNDAFMTCWSYALQAWNSFYFRFLGWDIVPGVPFVYVSIAIILMSIFFRRIFNK